MPLPETIPVKFTEEEAEYVSIRPVVHQQFRPAELIDMILSVTGKDLPRIQQILRAGTIVFHSYRYWWRGFEADAPAVRDILSSYPDPDFSRPFQIEHCEEVILESGGVAGSRSIRFRRAEANKKRLLRSCSFWECLMRLSREVAPAYREYSYADRADFYSAPLQREHVARVALDAKRYATRPVGAPLAAYTTFSQIVYACPRAGPVAQRLAN
jgi:hypothetical protein